MSNRIAGFSIYDFRMEYHAPTWMEQKKFPIRDGKEEGPVEFELGPLDGLRLSVEYSCAWAKACSPLNTIYRYARYDENTFTLVSVDEVEFLYQEGD